MKENVTKQTCSKQRRSEVQCKNCGLINMLELLEGENSQDLSKKILTKKKPLFAGERLFEVGQTFSAVFAIKSGALKSYMLLGGKEQVIGFHLPGELLGLDAVNAEYRCTTVALEESSVCELNFKHLKQLNEQYQIFQEQLINLTSQQILQEQRQSLLAARRTADERLAAFLLNFSERQAELGFNATTFRLIMSRQDIANYLGLVEATVSRAMQRFQRQELLRVSGKCIEILGREGLHKIAISGSY